MADWRPILSGEQADRARAAAQDIARAIIAADPDDASLLRGAAGFALFLSYYAGAFDDDTAAERAGELIAQAGRHLAEQPMPPGLYAGFTGVAWTVDHIAGAPPGDPDDPNEEIDDAIADLVAVERWTGDSELVDGLVGIGLYALQRLPRPRARATLERILHHLEASAERSEAGAAWSTPIELMTPAQRALGPDGARNLGVAHGNPGVLALLGRLATAGIGAERASALFDAGASWLWAQRLPDEGRGRFGAVPVERQPTRLAWCYGDLGIAVAMLSAARCVGSTRWESEALALARSAAARRGDDTGVNDASLCHGALGNAHLYNRIYQATGEEAFGRVALEWLERGLAMRTPGAGAGGFLAWDPTVHDFRPLLDFLSGAAGMGLVLLASSTETEPRWDRLLLADVMPMR